MKIKEVLIGLIIGIVLLMFLVFGAKLIYEAPSYENYCNYTKIYETNNTAIQNQLSQECNSKFEIANEDYSKNLFILSIVISLMIIVGSAVLININSISGGLMLGSLMYLVYGTGSYWRYMNDWIRFAILGFALVILIYVGYWLNNKENKKRSKK